jgi:hypothetical protein
MLLLFEQRFGAAASLIRISGSISELHVKALRESWLSICPVRLIEERLWPQLFSGRQIRIV